MRAINQHLNTSPWRFPSELPSVAEQPAHEIAPPCMLVARRRTRGKAIEAGSMALGSITTPGQRRHHAVSVSVRAEGMPDGGGIALNASAMPQVGQMPTIPESPGVCSVRRPTLRE